jgi:hypothetical protein
LLAISNEPVEQLQKILPQESEGVSLTLVDLKTFETIQKLIEAGVLQLG